jgi:hypothetical protein
MTTATVNPTSINSRGALSADRQPPPQTIAPAIDFGPRQSFLRLVRIELRKTVDTRSGRLLLAGIIALSVLILGWQLTHLAPGPLAFGSVLDGAIVPVDLILPVVGILAMTSEWTQRTALTTFTLSPRRIPVLVAKLVAALTIATVMVAVVVALAFAGTALGGVLGGDGATYHLALKDIGGDAIADGLNLLMAAGFGLVTMQTAAGVLGYYVAPTAWALGATELLHGNAKWLDIFTTFDNLSRFDVSSHVLQTVTSIGFWIVLPVTVGLILANRREVK